MFLTSASIKNSCGFPSASLTATKNPTDSFPSNDYYSTTLEVTGELIITHHDYNNAIISGTFWFDAINNIEEKIEVREGRFDMEY